MATDKYHVSTPIEAYCTKCKVDRQSVIETLKSDGNIHKVVCDTCEGSHLFRRPKGDGTKKPRAPRKRKGAFIAEAEDLERAKPYSMAAAFEVGEIIQHKTFGTGSVAVVRPDGKMEVGFEFGPKLLVCNR